MIKKLADITHVTDLGLSKKCQKLVSSYDPKDIVIAARQHKLTNFDGIGKIKATRITKELTTSGYIHHESIQSQRIRQLLIKARAIDRPSNTEEYESRVEFTAEQISFILDFLDDILTSRENKIITLRFGLSGEQPLTRSECDKECNVIQDRIRQIEDKALRKLRQPNRKRILQKILHGSPYPIPQPVEAKVKPTQDSSHDELTIEELDLSVRSYNCLTSRAGIKTVGQLRQLSQTDLLRIRNFGRKSLEEIFWKMKQLGITLEE